MTQPMEHATADAGDPGDPWERRFDALYRFLPYPLLAVSVVLAALIAGAGYKTWTAFGVSVALAVVAAVWSLLSTLQSDPKARPRTMITYFGGRTLLAGALVAINPWYGLYGFVGYLEAFRILPKRLVPLGVLSTAAVMAASQMVGFPALAAGPIAVYAFLVLVNGAMAFVFGHIGNRTMEQNREHRSVISELGDANRRLELALQENTGLHAQLVAQAREAGILDERQRLAGEIHDTLAQGLTGIVTQLEAAEQARHVPEEWQRHFGQARSLARESLVEARRSVRALRPEQLDTAGLPDAIAAMARRWAQTAPSVALAVDTTGDPRPLAADVEAALFRVAQEALTNVAKHAQASKVRLTLSYLDDVVLLDVRDDGLGFDPANAVPADAGSGFGLDAMRQRLGRVNGTLEVESAPAEGTAISACVPTVEAAAR